MQIGILKAFEKQLSLGQLVRKQKLADTYFYEPWSVFTGLEKEPYTGLKPADEILALPYQLQMFHHFRFC